MVNIEFTNKFYKFDIKKFNNIEVYFSGYLHFENTILENQEALDFIYQNIKQFNDKYLYEDFFNTLNGSWSIVIISNDNIILASDFIRAIPIYYSYTNDTIYISDSTHLLVDKLNLDKTIKFNIDKYIKIGTAPSGETILENLYDIEAGHFIVWNKKKITNIRYWNMPSKLQEINEKYLLEKSNFIFDIVFKRMKNYLDKYSDLPIFLPLSGGMDSRLIAWAIKKYNIQNRVISFTYGKNENVEEAKISKQLAKKLGFEWEFIEYTDEKWKRLRKEFKVLIDNFSVHKSGLHINDILSIEYLKEKYGLGIVVPGHLMDHFAGLSIPNELKFINNIETKYFGLKKISYENKLSSYEEFYRKNRTASFIINSCRTYEYFNLKVYMPFNDTQLSSFWYSMPTKYRIERNLFRSYLNKYAYVDEYKFLLDISIALGRRTDDKFIKLNNKDKIKIIVKYYLRKMGLTDFIKKLNKKKIRQDNKQNDYIGFYNLFDDKELGFNKYDKNYLELIAQLVLNTLKRK